MPSAAINDNTDTECITENPSNTNSLRLIYNDLLTTSDLTTEKSRLENQK